MLSIKTLNTAPLNALGTSVILAGGNIAASANILDSAVRYAKSFTSISGVASASTATAKVYRQRLTNGQANGRVQMWNDKGLTTVHAITPIYTNVYVRARGYARAIPNAKIASGDLSAGSILSPTATRIVHPKTFAGCSGSVIGTAQLKLFKGRGFINGLADMHGEPKIKYAGNTFYHHFATQDLTPTAQVTGIAKRLKLTGGSIFGFANLIGNETHKQKAKSFLDCTGLILSNARKFHIFYASTSIISKATLYGNASDRIKTTSGTFNTVSNVSGVGTRARLATCNINGVCTASVSYVYFAIKQANIQCFSNITSSCIRYAKANVNCISISNIDCKSFRIPGGLDGLIRGKSTLLDNAYKECYPKSNILADAALDSISVRYAILKSNAQGTVDVNIVPIRYAYLITNCIGYVNIATDGTRFVISTGNFNGQVDLLNNGYKNVFPSLNINATSILNGVSIRYAILKSNIQGNSNVNTASIRYAYSNGDFSGKGTINENGYRSAKAVSLISGIATITARAYKVAYPQVNLFNEGRLSSNPVRYAISQAQIFGYISIKSNEIRHARCFSDLFLFSGLSVTSIRFAKASALVTGNASSSLANTDTFHIYRPSVLVNGTTTIQSSSIRYAWSFANCLGDGILNSDSIRHARIDGSLFGKGLFFGKSKITVHITTQQSPLVCTANIEAYLRANADSQAAPHRIYYVFYVYRTLIVPYENRTIRV